MKKKINEAASEPAAIVTIFWFFLIRTPIHTANAKHA